jgi:hypothetical protein
MLQAGRSRVRIPTRSFDFLFFNLPILPVALWPEVYSASNRNEHQEYSWEVKRGRRLILKTSRPSLSSRKCGILDVSQPYRGSLLYFSPVSMGHCTTMSPQPISCSRKCLSGYQDLHHRQPHTRLLTATLKAGIRPQNYTVSQNIKLQSEPLSPRIPRNLGFIIFDCRSKIVKSTSKCNGILVARSVQT